MSDSGTLSLPKEDGAAFNADDFSRAVADLKEKGKLAEMTRLGVGSLLGEDAFHDELMQVMKHRMPKETAALLKSSGNMHNPAVTAFYRDFGDLLLATPSFRKMNEVLAGVSRTIGQPDFEKLSYTKGEDGDQEEKFEEYFSPIFCRPMPDLFDLPTGCPDPVRVELRGAFSLFWAHRASCAGRIRVALERLMDHLGAPKKRKNKHGKFLAIQQRVHWWCWQRKLDLSLMI